MRFAGAAEVKNGLPAYLACQTRSAFPAEVCQVDAPVRLRMVSGRKERLCFADYIKNSRCRRLAAELRTPRVPVHALDLVS